MDFKQYQYVLKVAELRSITKAAAELYITQPYLSHYIAKIEDELGVMLFDRASNPLTLTLAGEKYVETARMILNLNDRLKNEVSEIAQNRKGIIRVGLSHARASFFLPYVMPAFRERYPGIDIRTTEVRSDLVEEYVDKGQCDFGIVPLPVSGRYAFDTEVICREELLLISGEPLPGAKEAGGRLYVEFDQLGGRSFSLLKKGHGIRTAVDVLFMEHEIRPGSVFETTSNETAYRLATVSMGLSIVPETTVLLSRGVDKSYFYSLTQNGFFWDIGAVCRRRELLTGAQKYFIRLLKEQFSGRLGRRAEIMTQNRRNAEEEIPAVCLKHKKTPCLAGQGVFCAAVFGGAAGPDCCSPEEIVLHNHFVMRAMRKQAFYAELLFLYPVSRNKKELRQRPYTKHSGKGFEREEAFTKGGWERPAPGMRGKEKDNDLQNRFAVWGWYRTGNHEGD